MKLQGKVALVTGSSTGIGQAIAIRFANEGADFRVWGYPSSRGREARGRSTLASTRQLPE